MLLKETLPKGSKDVQRERTVMQDEQHQRTRCCCIM